MIYKNSYFRKELRQAYIENQINTKRKLTLGVFLGLISIALHFLLLSLGDSVLAETVPYLLQKTFFSTVFTYISASFVLYLIYYFINYDYLSFAEIRKNRWYLLVKMGYNPRGMIFSKIAAMLFSLFFVYTTGFFTTLLMTVFLKYSFISSYLSALYVIGLLDLIIICIIGATVSLFTNKASVARYTTLFSAVLLYILKEITGYRSIISSEKALSNDGIVTAFSFTNSPYYVIAGFIILICLIISYYRAKDMAKYYSVQPEYAESDFPAYIKIARYDERSDRFFIIDTTKKAKRRSKFIDRTIMLLLILFVGVSIAFNVFILMISSSHSGNQFTIKGTIPYIIESDRMAPEIQKNDLVFFTKTEDYTSVDINHIVLFKSENVFDVQRVKKIDGSRLTVANDKSSEEQTISRSQVNGIYSGRNRWLGLLILFANSITGRILFLFAPVFVLFFYNPIKSFLARISKLSDME